MSLGAYGTKLLGSGGCGFVLVISNSLVKQKIEEKYNGYVLNVNFDNVGVCEILKNET